MVRVAHLGAVLLAAAIADGCASAEIGPPTVDVTGFWVGTWYAPNMGSGVLELRLVQQGALVTGDLVWRGSMEGPRAGASINPTGPLTGKVEGRRFSFDRGSVPAKGELTVEGDEMRGYVLTTRDADVRVRRQR
jgi:hypothetical protein